MSGDPFQVWQFSSQFKQQAYQAVYLGHWVRIGHDLLAGIKPVRVTTVIIQFYSNAARIETANVMGDSFRWNPSFNSPISFYIEMSRVTGAGFRIVDALTVISCSNKIRKLGAVDNDKVYRFQRPDLQARYVR